MTAQGGSGRGRAAAVHVPDGMDESSYTPIAGSGAMRYRPLKELGSGGMARVLLACGVGPSGFTKLVVLKVIRREMLANPAAREMFLTEARLSARLNHPNVVQVNEVVQTGALPYIVMEHLDGKPLSAIKLGAEFDQSMMLTVIAEALHGLHHAHELRDFDGTALHVVHRDVTPHNVFVTFDGVVKVLDFGIAKAATSTSDTQTGEIKGKLKYMAPEQLLGQAIDRRTDIFSVGCMLWEAAVGTRLWENVEAVQLMRQLVTGAIPRPSARAQVDPELERIVLKATAAEPADRYDTALELHSDLESYLEGSGRLRSLRDVGATIAAMHREEREEQSRLIRTLMTSAVTDRDSAVTEPDVAIATTTTVAIPRKKWLAVGAPALAIALVALVAILTLLPRTQPAAPAPSAAPTPPSAITIRVTATPATASIRIDDQERGTGSAALSVPADRSEHSLQVSATGYEPQTRRLTFDREQSLDIRLERLPTELAAIASAEPEPSPRPSRNAPRAAARGKVATPNGSASAASCEPPYFFSNGLKTFKPECI